MRCLGGKYFRQAVDQLGQAFFVLLEVADFLALGADLVRHLGVNGFALLALFLKFAVLLLLLRLDFLKFFFAFPGVGGKGFLFVQCGVDLAHQFSTGSGDGRKVVQVARHLIRVIAVEQ
ncbi:MAG: hypothetical protein HT580_11025 [Dechloromonas sp.]|nr:MAG: hypothetical protein HT580_11025 [Dechloromonas sp.]